LLGNLNVVPAIGGIRQLLAYFGVSAIALAADFAVLVISKEYGGFNYIGASTFGLLVGTVVHYCFAKSAVFRTGRLSSRLAEFLAYAALGGVAMLASLGVILALTELGGFDYRVSKIPAVGVSFLLGFALRKRLLFDVKLRPQAGGMEDDHLARGRRLLHVS
jgi:putative flippase GtrA